jgi:YD repeat-containing protein
VASTTFANSIVTMRYDQGYGLSTAFGEQSDGFAQIGHPYRMDVSESSGAIKQRTYYRWDTIAHSVGTFVGLGSQMTEDFASDGTHRDKATTYTYSPTNDDLLSSVNYGEVTGNSDGTFTDTGSDTRTTAISYAASSSVNMSVPVEKTLFDNSNATSSDEKIYYDSLSFGQVSTGNNTKVEDLISGSTYASSTKRYNLFGLVATSTDRNGNGTSYVCDAYNLNVATTANALLQKTQFHYNYANGKVKWKSDPNNSLTKNVYDGLGRITETDVSSTSTPTAYATTTTYVYTDSTSTTSSIKRTDWLSPSITVDSYQ